SPLGGPPGRDGLLVTRRVVGPAAARQPLERPGDRPGQLADERGGPGPDRPARAVEGSPFGAGDRPRTDQGKIPGRPRLARRGNAASVRPRLAVARHALARSANLVPGPPPALPAW